MLWPLSMPLSFASSVWPSTSTISVLFAFFSSMWPSTCTLSDMLSVEKAFEAGPGYAQIPSKLVSKITSGVFVELTDLLAETYECRSLSPIHTCIWMARLVSPARKRVLEITNNILTGFSAVFIQLAGTTQVIDLAESSQISWACLAEL